MLYNIKNIGSETSVTQPLLHVFGHSYIEVDIFIM